VTYTLVMAEQIVRLILRLPDDVHAALTEWAREEERSLNGHILYLLRRALADRRGA
jgi:hypothetical protein